MDRAAELTSKLAGKRFGVVGVGNALKGDDGAGPAVAAALAGAPFPVVDATEVPENYGGWVVKRGLDSVVFVDAVAFGGSPGEWRLVAIEELMHSASNTHRLSLHFTIQYLREEWGGEAILVGIEPKSINLGDGLSPEVDAAVKNIASALLAAAAAGR